MPTRESFMRAALEQAEKAALLGEVPVGAVVVKDGIIVAAAHNLRETDNDPTAHAELLAVRRAAVALGSRRLTGCELYVTLEPCPMCAGAAIHAQVAGIIYGASDPKTGALGSVCNLAAMPLGHAPFIKRGVLERECALPLEKFFEGLRRI